MPAAVVKYHHACLAQCTAAALVARVQFGDKFVLLAIAMIFA
jgi:hypothetical protein